MSYLVICAVALLASALTFYSGFGLGTLLLPAFALFFPIEQAIALTAVVHFLNGLFKLVLVVRHADWGVVLRFGHPAIVAAAVGAWALVWLADAEPVLTYTILDRPFSVTAIKLVVGLLLLLIASLELSRRFRTLAFSQRYMSVGGLVSGFIGGLSGMQGALRSAFLARAGLTKEAFIGTGVVVAILVDIARLTIYAAALARESASFNTSLLAAAVLAAFLGAALGNRHLTKMTMPGIQRVVANMLFVFATGLVTGIL